MNEAAIQLEAVQLGYRWPKRRMVLEEIDFLARPGQVSAIVGPNGVGKTTLFRSLLGFLKPWKGSIEIGGLAPATYRLQRGIGYLPEVVSLPAGYTLIEFLLAGALLSGLDRREARAAVEAAMTDVDLLPASKRLLHTFSKGMGRRAALAFVLLGNSSVLLLDEPLSGLDARARVALREAVRSAARRGTTVVVASHDLDEVKRTADAAYVFDRGHVIRRIERTQLESADLERLVIEAERLQ